MNEYLTKSSSGEQSRRHVILVEGEQSRRDVLLVESSTDSRIKSRRDDLFGGPLSPMSSNRGQG